MAKSDDNLKGIKQAIVDADKEIGEIEAQRKACTSDITGVIERLERIGISRHAVRFGRRYMKMDENERRSLDTAYRIVREALGAPIQGDLLDTISEFADAKKAEEEKEKQRQAAKAAKTSGEPAGDTQH